MAKDLKWDISRMTQLARMLAQARDVIEKNKDFLVSINTEVEHAWQGYTGRAFGQHMEIDVENLEKVITGINDFISDLEKVTSSCYEACETDIQAEIDRLKAKI